MTEIKTIEEITTKDLLIFSVRIIPRSDELMKNNVQIYQIDGKHGQSFPPGEN